MNDPKNAAPLTLEGKVVILLGGLFLSGAVLFGATASSIAFAQTPLPTFSVSQTTVPYGTTVTVYWNAGAWSPGGCIVYVTNQNVSNYAPWGVTASGANGISIFSDTTLTAVCLGAQGEYVYPSPSSITVRVATEPKISVSSAHVAAGGSTQVVWDGGPAAGTCGVYVTDATRNNAVFKIAASGSETFSPTSDTTFNMTCINKIDGAYLSPQPTARVTVDQSAATSCPSGQTLYSNVCYANTKTCTIAQGTGTQTFSNGSYGSCVATSCNAGFTLNTAANECQALPRACNMGDGSGTQTWNGSSWGTCVVHHCTSGYTLHNNACYAPYTPRLAVSATKVAAGDRVMLTWDGGAYAGTCVVYVTDATRNYTALRTALSGTETVVITANTRFDMTCINKVDGGYLQPRPSISVTVDTNPLSQALTRMFATLNYDRAQKWAQTAGIWEVWWDGAGNTPGDSAAGAFGWSVPFDDDWNEPRVAAESFAFDTPSVGFMTINRTDPRDIHKGGIIVRHDEYLNVESGITIEFRAKVHPNSAEDAFNLIYSTGPRSLTKGAADPTFELFISPNKIIAGGYGEQRINPTPPTVAFNSTDDFHVYRLVQQPGSKHFALYVDNKTTPILEADGNYHKVSFFDDHDTPYIMLGAESGNRPANVTIDYIRYRRGAFPPGASFTVPLPRMAPLLPPSIDTASVWTILLDGTKTPQQAGYTLARNPSSWTTQGDGTLKLDSRTDAGTFQFIADPMPGVTDIKGPYTIELRAKILSGNTNRGFALAVVNGKTSLSLILSPGKVETAMGLKPAAYQAYVMDTTDAFHTYRLVHPARSQYGYLYVDDNPVPVIVDQHGSADTWRDHLLLEMGSLPMVERQNPTGVRSHVLIDYVRVSPTAFAPALP